MNLLSPVSSIMDRDLHVVSPNDCINHIKDIFELKRVVNLPVLKQGLIIGIINKQRFRSFCEGLNKHADTTSLQKYLHLHTAEEVMNKRVLALEVQDCISLALEMLRDNVFSALPVLDGQKLVGIVTSLDIIKTLAKDKVMN